MKELYKKLLAIQTEIGAIKKDSENPYFKSMYFDINSLLDELKPVLNKHGVIVVQPLTSKEGRPTLTTRVVDAESGEFLETECLIPENIDPQKIGSAITYFRRYSLQSLFLLQAEDDDGETASQSVQDAPGRVQPVKRAPITPKVPPGTPQKGVPLCSHGEAMVIRQQKKAGPNQGREFYACPRKVGEGCGAFIWVDEYVAMQNQPEVVQAEL